MKYRSFVFALLSACCALWIAASAARAAPPSAAGLGVSSPPPLLIRVGHGCGWDYACPPEPGYGRPPAPRGNVYIHNNYGPVTVYRGYPSRPGVASALWHGMPGRRLRRNGQRMRCVLLDAAHPRRLLRPWLLGL